MNWIENIAERAKNVTAQTDAADFGGLGPPLVEWLTVLLDELKGLKEEFEWNRISMEIWLDSGRLLGYPALGSYEVSQWPVAVELTIPFLAVVHNQAASEDEEDQSVSSPEYKLWMALRQAFRNAEVKHRLNDLKKSKVFTIWRQTGGDLSTASQFMV